MDIIEQKQAQRMSAYDLARWRIDDTLYARRIETEDGEAYAVYAADGTYLDQVDTLEEVMEAVKNNDMHLASVH